MPTARLYQRQGILIQLPIALAAIALMAWIWVRWMPMPPTELVFSAGRPDGVYHAQALQYVPLFAKRGVTLTVVESEGAQQNLDRLLGRDPKSAAVHLAFMQGGVGYPPGEPGATVRTLANVNVEPLWIFSRHPWIDSIQQLNGLKVSLGPRGSGTRRVGMHLLDLFRVRTTDIEDSELAGDAALQALRNGTLDVAMMVLAPEAPVISAALRSPGIHLVQLRRSAAILDRLPYLQARLLPQGALDGGGRVPPTDVNLLTTLASLVSRGDLDPALQRLAAQVATEVHAPAGRFHRAGEFPSLRRADFPASPAARDTLVHGLPWIEDKLPFWWSQLLMRVVLICLPIALLAAWLAQLLPRYLRWMLQSRITRWYGELKYIEHDLQREAVTDLDLSRYVTRLDRIDRRLLAMQTPPDLRERWFLLRQHIDFVRMGLYRRRGR